MLKKMDEEQKKETFGKALAPTRHFLLLKYAQYIPVCKTFTFYNLIMFIGIDLGTSSIKTILIDENQKT